MKFKHKLITDENNNDAFLMVNPKNNHAIVRSENVEGWVMVFDSLDQIPKNVDLSNFIKID